MRALNPRNAHFELVRNSLKAGLAESDALLWMVLLHTHEIHVRADFVEKPWRDHQEGGAVVFPALTQRGVAAVVAKLWLETKLKKKSQGKAEPRTNYIHWYWEYNTRVPYEIVEQVPAGLRPRLEELRAILEQDPRVFAVVPED